MDLTNSSGPVMSETEDDDSQMSKKDVSLYLQPSTRCTFFFSTRVLINISKLFALQFLNLRTNLFLRKTANAGTARRRARRSELWRRRSRRSRSSRRRRVAKKRRKKSQRLRSSTSQRSQRFTTPTTFSSRGSSRRSR